MNRVSGPAPHFDDAMERSSSRDRPSIASVAVPSEHGGWGLTLEPVLLGLLLAWSVAGLLVGLATVLGFLARTPLKVILVDRHRGRWLVRSRMATIVLLVESLVIAGLVVGATWLTGWRWWVPVLVAVPLLVVELWFDARSRSRRLLPELLGAVGVAAAVAAISLAGDADWRLAAGAWLVLAARAVGSIPFVRNQIFRLRRGMRDTRPSDVAQLASVVVGAGAVVFDTSLAVGLLGVVGLALFQVSRARKLPSSIKALGFTQMGLGFALVALTAVGVALG